jgi:N6-L-threonylcarbamoyladenine synthase
MRLILGIETSCDETAASVVNGKGTTLNERLLSNVVLSQMDMHKVYGGVVPEIAARAHLDHIQAVVQEAVDKSGYGLKDLEAITATIGPGLIGGVLVGANFAKALCMALNKPFIGINHLEGHALTPRLSHQVAYPYVLLLISGGHCQFVDVLGLGQYKVLGSTLDDALGEAFDKCAKMLGLSYPGGPFIEKYAAYGDKKAYALPRPLMGREGCDFSFSGLKTAVRRLIEKQRKEEGKAQGPLSDSFIADVCASFQKAVCDVLLDRLKQALSLSHHGPKRVVVAGGVAANKAISKALHAFLMEKDIQFVAPPAHLCTDNAAMIAWAGAERFEARKMGDIAQKTRPRWGLGELS